MCRYLALTLSAEYACHAYKDAMADMMPYVDIVFGNTLEAHAYAAANRLFSHHLHNTAGRNRGFCQVFCFLGFPDFVRPPGTVVPCDRMFSCGYFCFFFFSARDLRAPLADRPQTLPHDRQRVQFLRATAVPAGTAESAY